MLSLNLMRGDKIVIGPPENPLGTVEYVRVHGSHLGAPKIVLAFDFPREIEVNREVIAKAKAYTRKHEVKP